MKKRNLKSLKLNKKSISRINNHELTGGTGLTAVELSCHWFTCHSVNNDCPSANVKPYCFVKYTEQVDCEG
ncbi:hypothetical protein EZY14_014915 [Kordia sp. TARA_039_SRF]|jgi:hypothetical protein|nr:hypothetical protein EZY14_014915 [Kordia sp. TARA_039_SRF]